MIFSKYHADLFLKDITERPKDFIAGEFYLLDKNSKRKWWIANGGSHFALYDNLAFDFGYMQILFWSFTSRGKCWRAYKKWASENPMNTNLSFAEMRLIERHD